MSREPRPGDEVEVQLPGVVHPNGLVKFRSPIGSIHRTATLDGLRAANAKIVVTLPVDHPSRDLVGTVRGDATHVWVKIDKYPPPSDPGYVGIWWNVLDGEERTGDHVEEWPVLGAVPGTPADRRGDGEESS